MVDLSKIKITKKSYRFDIRKKYQKTIHLKVKEVPPIEKIKTQIKKMFEPKKQKATQTTNKLPSANQSPGGFNFSLLFYMVLIAALIGGLAYLYLSSQINQSIIIPSNTDAPSIKSTITSAMILSGGRLGSDTHIAAALLDQKIANIDNYTVNLTVYEDRIPSEVFVLNSDKEDASIYPEFLSSLRLSLLKKNIRLNEISEKQIEKMPQGAIIIIPSGVIPKSFLLADSSNRIEKLIDRGHVIIYIGQSFSKMLDGNIVSSTPSDLLSSIPFNFDENNRPQSESGFQLFQPLYRVTQRIGGESKTAYGSVSIAKKGSGAILFLPQTLNGGWKRNATLAAADVSRIIFEVPWSKTLAPSKIYTFDNSSSSKYVFSEPIKSTKGTIRLDIFSSKDKIEQTQFVFANKSIKGELYIEEDITILSSNITGVPIRLNAKLAESKAAQTNVALKITSSTDDEIDSISQGSINLQAERAFDFPIYVAKGEYIVSLIDENDPSKIYAQTYIRAVTPEISYSGILKDKKSVYLFEASMDGKPLSAQKDKVSLKDISVKVDSGKFGTYTLADVSGTISIDVGANTGGQSLPSGDHYFDFSSGGFKTSVKVPSFVQESIFTSPLFWGVLVLCGIIVVIGIVFARAENTFYNLDVPDFPPVAKTKIPLSSDAVLNIFEKVNETYRWQNTPLTPTELKNGFKDVFYKGKPVYITDYNAEYLLETLEHKGLVKQSLDYFGLSSWETKLKKSMKYLSMMRKIRDICVNNAIPFTGVGESKVCDSEVSTAGQQMYLHLFDSTERAETVFTNAMKTINSGISIILFSDEQEKSKLASLLHSPSQIALTLKMEAENGTLQLLSLKEFEKLVMDFKSM